MDAELRIGVGFWGGAIEDMDLTAAEFDIRQGDERAGSFGGAKSLAEGRWLHGPQHTPFVS